MNLVCIVNDLGKSLSVVLSLDICLSKPQTESIPERVQSPVRDFQPQKASTPLPPSIATKLAQTYIDDNNSTNPQPSSNPISLTIDQNLTAPQVEAPLINVIPSTPIPGTSSHQQTGEPNCTYQLFSNLMHDKDYLVNIFETTTPRLLHHNTM